MKEKRINPFLNFDKIEYTKINNKTIIDARKRIKDENDKCLICGKQVSSFCNSHSIPYSVLDKMDLENGELIPFQNAAMAKLLTKVTKGKNNSSIFKSICRECDQLFFDKLDNMDVINDEWDNKLLRLQAVRILLYKMYRLKEFTYSYYELDKELYNKEFIKTQQQMDLDDYNYYLNIINSLLENENEEFDILYSKVLDYEIDFATATLLHIDVNPFLDTIIKQGTEDKIIMESYDIDDMFFNVIKLDKNRESNSSIYFIAFPFNGKTKILMFCDKNSIAGLLLKICFDEMNESEILNYISATLVIHGNNMYGNEKFMKLFRKCCNFFKEKHQHKFLNGENIQLYISDLIELYSYLMNDEYNLFKK